MKDFILNNYPWILALVVILAWKKWRRIKMKPLIKEYLSQGAMIVDVRTPEEFHGSHCEGSINIPLQTLESRFSELDKNKHIIVCCASGGRSAVAMNFLTSRGYKKVINAGPWTAARECKL